MKVEPQNAALPAAGGTGVPALPAVVTRATLAATAAALAGTLGLAAACWVIAVWQMHGMDMGSATQLGSFGFFIAVWVAMMAAMMLPGAAPAVLRRAQASGGVRAVPLFIGSYLAVWALVGAAVYALYRPHGYCCRRRGYGRGRCLRVHAAQAALPPALPRERPLWTRVRAVLRRLEHRADGHAGGAGRHERDLDVGDRRPRPRPKAPAAQSRRRCAAGAGDHRGLVSGSSSRPRRFPGSCHRCETSSAARARPSCTTRQEGDNQ